MSENEDLVPGIWEKLADLNYKKDISISYKNMGCVGVLLRKN